jgi:hypothetical protein
MADTPPVPPIPDWLNDCPTVGGLVVPWITPRSADGRFLFGAIDATRTERALRQRRCGVCGRHLDDRLVLMMRLSDLPQQGSAEPGLHPVCAHYTTSACPMINGRLGSYRSTPIRLDKDASADATSESTAEQTARQGAPAEPWFAVWLGDYHLADIAGHLAASYAGTRPLRIRPVTWRSLPLW